MATKEYVSAALRAASAVRKAVLDGELPNLKTQEVVCSNCKNARATQYDHRDYNKPLQVAPVCASCNGKLGKAKFDPSKAAKPMNITGTHPVKVDSKLYDTLRAIAKRRGMLISALLNKILAQYFGEQQKSS